MGVTDELGRVIVHGPIATQDAGAGLWFLDDAGVWHRHTDVEGDEPIIVGAV